MEPLQHDPKVKYEIKKALFSFLYAPLRKQMRERLDVIISTNTLLGKFTHNSFTYKGEFYTCDSLPSPLRKNPLLPKVKPLMDEYLDDERQINLNELPIVVGFIDQLLNSSNSLEDYLKVLPEAMHTPIKQFISSCPCCHKELSDEEIQRLKEMNEKPINLLKERMVSNLLLS